MPLSTRLPIPAYTPLVQLPFSQQIVSRTPSPFPHGAPHNPGDPPKKFAASRIGAPVRREEAGAAARDSGGGFAAATDREILDWFGYVVRDEGVFCEPSSAASLAGLANARRDGLVPEGAEVVCVLTGNGLKDPDTAISESAPPITIPAERAALERIVLGDTA